MHGRHVMPSLQKEPLNAPAEILVELELHPTARTGNST